MRSVCDPNPPAPAPQILCHGVVEALVFHALRPHARSGEVQRAACAVLHALLVGRADAREDAMQRAKAVNCEDVLCSTLAGHPANGPVVTTAGETLALMLSCGTEYLHASVTEQGLVPATVAAAAAVPYHVPAQCAIAAIFSVMAQSRCPGAAAAAVAGIKPVFCALACMAGEHELVRKASECLFDMVRTAPPALPCNPVALPVATPPSSRRHHHPPPAPRCDQRLPTHARLQAESRSAGCRSALEKVLVGTVTLLGRSPAESALLAKPLTVVVCAGVRQLHRPTALAEALRALGALLARAQSSSERLSNIPGMADVVKTLPELCLATLQQHARAEGEDWPEGAAAAVASAQTLLGLLMPAATAVVGAGSCDGRPVRGPSIGGAGSGQPRGLTPAGGKTAGRAASVASAVLPSSKAQPGLLPWRELATLVAASSAAHHRVVAGRQLAAAASEFSTSSALELVFSGSDPARAASVSAHGGGASSGAKRRTDSSEFVSISAAAAAAKDAARLTREAGVRAGTEPVRAVTRGAFVSSGKRNAESQRAAAAAAPAAEEVEGATHSTSQAAPRAGSPRSVRLLATTTSSTSPASVALPRRLARISSASVMRPQHEPLMADGLGWSEPTSAPRYSPWGPPPPSPASVTRSAPRASTAGGAEEAAAALSPEQRRAARTSLLLSATCPADLAAPEAVPAPPQSRRSTLPGRARSGPLPEIPRSPLLLAPLVPPAAPLAGACGGWRMRRLADARILDGGSTASSNDTAAMPGQEWQHTTVRLEPSPTTAPAASCRAAKTLFGSEDVPATDFGKESLDKNHAVIGSSALSRTLPPLQAAGLLDGAEGKLTAAVARPLQPTPPAERSPLKPAIRAESRRSPGATAVLTLKGAPAPRLATKTTSFALSLEQPPGKSVAAVAAAATTTTMAAAGRPPATPLGGAVAALRRVIMRPATAAMVVPVRGGADAAATGFLTASSPAAATPKKADNEQRRDPAVVRDAAAAAACAAEVVPPPPKSSASGGRLSFLMRHRSNLLNALRGAFSGTGAVKATTDDEDSGH